MHTKLKGSISELAVAKRLYELGFSAFRPLDDCSPIDIVAVRLSDMKMFKVQVKTAKLTGDTIYIGLTTGYDWRSEHRKYKRKYLPEEVDIFAGYSPDLDQIFFLPFKEFENTKCACLRLEPPSNGQIKRIRYAKDFLEFPMVGPARFELATDELKVRCSTN